MCPFSSIGVLPLGDKVKVDLTEKNPYGKLGESFAT